MGCGWPNSQAPDVPSRITNRLPQTLAQFIREGAAVRVEHVLPYGLLGRTGSRSGGWRGWDGQRHRDGPALSPPGGAGLEPVMVLKFTMDGDTVSETNCMRQPFSISDVGQNKATVLHQSH